MRCICLERVTITAKPSLLSGKHHYAAMKRKKSRLSPLPAFASERWFAAMAQCVNHGEEHIPSIQVQLQHSPRSPRLRLQIQRSLEESADQPATPSGQNKLAQRPKVATGRNACCPRSF